MLQESAPPPIPVPPEELADGFFGALRWLDNVFLALCAGVDRGATALAQALPQLQSRPAE